MDRLSLLIGRSLNVWLRSEVRAIEYTLVCDSHTIMPVGRRPDWLFEAACLAHQSSFFWLFQATPSALQPSFSGSLAQLL